MTALKPRVLTFWYLAALSLVAMLSIASHVVLADMLRANDGSAAIINQSGRQRMLSQRITALSGQLRHGDETARPQLLSSIDAFRAAHVQLVGEADRASADTARALGAIYFGDDGLDTRVSRFVAAAGRIAATPTNPAALGATEGDMRFIAAQARQPLLERLDHVVRIYQAESEDRTRRLQMIQWLILATVVITLVLEALFIFRPMVTRITEHFGQILKLAEIDHLTNTLNRRAFMERAENELGRAARYRRPLALLIADVDHFKRVNDSFGHPIGDAVLIAVARRIREAARTNDIVGRFGGEEFAVVLPEATGDTAHAAAKRIRALIAKTPVVADGQMIPVSISIGIAEVDTAAQDSLARALREADAMLYAAKDAGRNCVRPLPGEV